MFRSSQKTISKWIVSYISCAFASHMKNKTRRFYKDTYTREFRRFMFDDKKKIKPYTWPGDKANCNIWCIEMNGEDPMSPAVAAEYMISIPGPIAKDDRKWNKGFWISLSKLFYAKRGSRAVYRCDPTYHFRADI